MAGRHFCWLVYHYVFDRVRGGNKLIDDETIRCLRINYKLDTLTPEGAATWWYTNNNGMAPATAVGALGAALEEIERLKKLLED